MPVISTDSESRHEIVFEEILRMKKACQMDHLIGDVKLGLSRNINRFLSSA